MSLQQSWMAAGVLVIGVGLFGASAIAQEKSADKSADKNAASKKRTNINFEDQLVEGELRKPELFYLLQKKQINFGRLIKMRENFLPELDRASEDLKRGGGEP